MPVVISERSSDQNLDVFVRSPNSPFDPEERFDLIDPRGLINDTDIRNDRTFSSEKILEYLADFDLSNYYNKTAIDDFFSGEVSGKKVIDWSKIINKSGVDFSYVHNQSAASATWVMTHNLGYIPSVSFFDSSGSEVMGNLTHTNSSESICHFSSAFTGTAYFS